MRYLRRSGDDPGVCSGREIRKIRSCSRPACGGFLGPFRTGLFYGVFAAAVALVESFYFLFLNPEGVSDWILAAIASFQTQMAFASYLFLGILAAIKVRPVRMDPESSYASLLVRDGALAATIVAMLVGITLIFSVALRATVFAEEVGEYAAGAAPKIAAYTEEVRSELSDPPPPTVPGEIEEALQPQEPRDVGRSIFNAVMRAILMGFLGALIGGARGRFGAVPGGSGTGKGNQDTNGVSGER